MKQPASPLAYLGYAQQACAILIAELTGGVPGYTYRWSTGESGLSIQVCPRETTIYTVTVTGARGATFTDSVQVYIVDVRCGSDNNAKVQMCHNPSGKSGKGKVLCVSENAVSV